LLRNIIVAHPKKALNIRPPINPEIAISRLSALNDSRVRDKSDLNAAIRHPKERKIDPRSPSPRANITV
jgi:hypothetical protein